MNSKYKIEEEREYKRRLEKRSLAPSSDGDTVRPSLVSAVQREKYEKVKTKVMGLERDNYSHIILFASSRGWYKIGGNSMLIYYYAIAKKILGLKLSVQPDTDYTGVIFKLGVICVRGTEALEKRLVKAGVLEKKREHGSVIVFDLNFKVTKDEIKQYADEMKFIQDRAVSVIKPVMAVEPPIYKRLRHIQKRSFEIARRTTVYDRDYSGLLVAGYGRKMTKYYLLCQEGDLDEKECWREVYRLARLFMIEIGFMVDLSIWRQDVAVAIGAEVLEVKRFAEKKLGGEKVMFKAGEVD